MIDYKLEYKKLKANEKDLESDIQIIESENERLFNQGKAMEITMLSLKIENDELTGRLNDQERFIETIKNIQAFIDVGEQLKNKLNSENK